MVVLPDAQDDWSNEDDDEPTPMTFDAQMSRGLGGH